jgi:hypothetical protein
MGLSFLEGLWPYAAGTPPKGAYPVNVFQEILHREEARVVRNAHMFSLVLFRVPESSRRNRQARELAAELSGRVRFTDVVGCYDERHLGVLLPETSREGAEKFADNVKSRLASKIPDLESELQLFHPPGSSTTEQEESAQLWLGARTKWQSDQPPKQESPAAR